MKIRVWLLEVFGHHPCPPPLAEDKSQRYPFVPRLSAVDDRRVAAWIRAGIDPGSAFGTCIPAIDRKFRLGAGSVQGRSWIQHLGKLFHHRGGGEHITGRIVVADIVLLQVLIDIAVEAREIHLMRFEKINVT